MSVRKVSCPGCLASLSIGLALPASLRCPRCRARFQASAAGRTRLTSTAPAGVNLHLLAAIAGGGVLFAAGGACLLVYCLQAPSAKLEAEIASDERLVALAKKPPSLTPDPVAALKKPPPQNGSPVSSVVETEMDAGYRPGVDKDVCSAEALQPANQPEINAAIDKGVAYLKRTFNDAGRVTGGVGAANGQLVGSSALAGLALMSCGVPSDDPKLIGIAARVRDEAPNLLKTYEVACCIWFLDKLGEDADRDLIRRLAWRLIAGQQTGGGWDYTVPMLSMSQEKELLQILGGDEFFRTVVIARPGVPAPPKPPPASPRTNSKGGGAKATKFPASNQPLPGDLRQLPALRFRQGQALQASGRHEDNSISQFAVLALWAAQKHGVPAAQSLAMAEARFRQAQNADGTWNYEVPPSISLSRVDSMTCAGLLTLAVGRVLDKNSVSAEPRDLALDPQIAKGLMFLSSRIGSQDLQKVQSKNGSSTKLLKTTNRGQVLHADSWGDYYFLWSLERVGVVYSLRTIGGKDWYDWGSKLIVGHQSADGSWNDVFPGPVDTCFALLFLKRVNVAVDLTQLLQSLGGARDPVQAQMRNRPHLILLPASNPSQPFYPV